MATYEPPDPTVLRNLSRELSKELSPIAAGGSSSDSHSSSRSSSQLSGHRHNARELEEEEARLTSKREAAAMDRNHSLMQGTNSLNQLREQLDKARAQGAESKQKLAQCRKDLQIEQNRAAVAEAQVEVLEGAVSDKEKEVARLEKLNQHLIDEVKSQRPDNAATSQVELRHLQSKVERAIKERDDARQQVKSLEQLLASKSSGLDSREADLRVKIEQAREEKVKVLQESVNHLEEEREQYEQTIADLRSQVSLQTEKLTINTRQIGEWEARHEQAELERDRAHEEVSKIRTTIQALRRENAERSQSLSASDSLSRASTGSQGAQTTVEDALAQRDSALAKCRRLQEQLRQERTASAIAADGITVAATEQLKAEISRLSIQNKQITKDLMDAIMRNTQTETAARHRISTLQQELDDARHVQSRSANDGNAELAMAALGSRQAEARAYKSAATELRKYVGQLVALSNRNNVQAEISDVLAATDTAHYDDLPDGWEMMISPDGLEYYVDHNRRITTWAHPSAYYDPDSGSNQTFARHAGPSGAIQSPQLNLSSDNHFEIHPEHHQLQGKISRLRHKHASQGSIDQV